MPELPLRYIYIIAGILVISNAFLKNICWYTGGVAIGEGLIMARNGGNPELDKYKFVAAGDEPLVAHLQIKIAPSQLEALKRKPRWQDWVRSVLENALASEATTI